MHVFGVTLGQWVSVLLNTARGHFGTAKLRKEPQITVLISHYLRINIKKTTGLCVNLSPVVVRYVKGDRNILS